MIMSSELMCQRSIKCHKKLYIIQVLKVLVKFHFDMQNCKSSAHDFFFTYVYFDSI